MELNKSGLKVFQLKYSKNRTKSWKDIVRKIAEVAIEGERVYNNDGISEDKLSTTKLTEDFYNMIYDLKFLPGGRIIANAGTGIKNLANCFVLGIEDSRTSIYKVLGEAAEVFAAGGGLGYNFSHIREEGAPIKTTGGEASGPLSFMTLFDQTGEVIQQASRRGAQIGILDIDHPDIEKFIDFKATPNHRNKRLLEEYDRNLKKVNGTLHGTKYYTVLERTLLEDQLTHFNVSVAITDSFMQAVMDNKEWELTSRVDGHVVSKVNAKDLLMKIAKHAWATGDPGCIFVDRINLDNLVPYIGKIESTNPCSEIPLLDGESCVLGSLNLHAFYDKKTKSINYAELARVTTLATRFLEDIVEVSIAPVEKINYMTKGLRKLGLGVLGFADLLIDMELEYGSDASIDLAEYLSWFISYHAWLESMKMAEERGPFPLYDRDKVDLYALEKVLNSEYTVREWDMEKVRNIGVRNSGVTGLAPTGSIAIIGGVNSGIEPFFALAYKRNITEGVGNIALDSLFEVNPALEDKLIEYKYNYAETKRILDYVVEHGTLKGCENVDEKLSSIFITADEISAIKHIAIQEVWQLYVSNAISKTINLPEEVTVEDIYQIYIWMWQAHLKGGTVYRSHSKEFEILNKGS